MIRKVCVSFFFYFLLKTMASKMIIASQSVQRFTLIQYIAGLQRLSLPTIIITTNESLLIHIQMIK